MTYFLDDSQETLQPRGNDQPLSTYFQGLSAATSQMLRDTNANFQRQMETKDESYAIAAPAAQRLGIDSIYEKYKDSVVSMDFLPQKPKTTDELFSMLGPNAPQMVLDMAREQAKANPDAWKDIDLSEQGIQSRVTAQRVKSDAEEQQILDMMPSGRASAEFIGGMAGMLADVRQIPFLVAGGGGGSILKIMGREAAINMAAEGVTLPSQFETAKELGKDEPDVVRTLSMAAAGGAVIGGAIGALGRAVSYYQGRSKTPRIPGVSRAMSDSIVSAAEDALSRGEDPVKAVAEAIKALPVEPLADVGRLEAITQTLDEFGPLRERVVPEVDRPFRVPQAATAIVRSEPRLPSPVQDIRTAVANAEKYRLARDRDPAAFDAVEESQSKIVSYRKWLGEMADAQDRDVRDLLVSLDRREQEVSSQIQTIKTGGKRGLQEQIKAIKAARQEAMSLSSRVETPDMAKVRRALLDEDERMRDFGPRVAKALRETEEISPTWEPRYQEGRPTGFVPEDANPGVEPATQRQRLEAAQNTPKRGIDRPMDDGLFDMGARQQMDMFSDPASKEARVVQDSIAADIRDQIKKGEDFLVDMADGKGERPASSVLDDLDAGDKASARMDICGKFTDPS